MVQWILIGVFAMCISMGILVAVLCLLYMNGDDELEEKFDKWIKEKESEKGDK